MKTKLIIAAVAALGATVAVAGEKWKDADADGDGYLTQDEFNTSHIVGMSERFSRIDTNTDGLLSKEELAAAHAERHAKHHGKKKGKRDFNPEKMVEHLDLDGSGSLSLAELENKRRSPDAETFMAADTDSSGELNAAELEAMMKARREAHRAEKRANREGTNN